MKSAKDARRQQIAHQLSRQLCSMSYLIAEIKLGYKPNECGVFARAKDGAWVNLANEKEVGIDEENKQA